MGDEGPEVRPPSAEVIVHVDRGNARPPGQALEPANPHRHRMRLRPNLSAFDELEIVDGVDDEEDHRRAVGSTAVEILRARSDSHEAGSDDSSPKGLAVVTGSHLPAGPTGPRLHPAESVTMTRIGVGLNALQGLCTCGQYETTARTRDSARRSTKSPGFDLPSTMPMVPSASTGTFMKKLMLATTSFSPMRCR